MKPRQPIRRGKRPRPISDKRAAQFEQRDAVREAVFRRDGWRCRFAGLPTAGDCRGPLTPHHVLKASQGGEFSEANIVSACAFHNDRCESDADFAAVAREHGLVRLSWE